MWFLCSTAPQRVLGPWKNLFCFGRNYTLLIKHKGGAFVSVYRIKSAPSGNYESWIWTVDAISRKAASFSDSHPVGRVLSHGSGDRDLWGLKSHESRPLTAGLYDEPPRLLLFSRTSCRSGRMGKPQWIAPWLSAILSRICFLFPDPAALCCIAGIWAGHVLCSMSRPSSLDSRGVCMVFSVCMAWLLFDFLLFESEYDADRGFSLRLSQLLKLYQLRKPVKKTPP